MNFQFSRLRSASRQSFGGQAIFKHGARGLVFILIFVGLVLGLPGTGQAAGGNLTITLKSVAALSQTKILNWELYNKPFAKETVNVGTLWSGLLEDQPPRKTIRDIPLVGSTVDGLIKDALTVLTIYIDPGKTGQEIEFKVPGLFDEYYKAENKEFDKTILGVTFSFKVVFGAAMGGFSLPNPLQANTFQELVERLIDFAFVVALALAPLMVLVAGLVFLTAGGKPEMITRARKILFWTLLGFVVVLLAKGLIAMLKSILGPS